MKSIPCKNFDNAEMTSWKLAEYEAMQSSLFKLDLGRLSFPRVLHFIIISSSSANTTISTGLSHRLDTPHLRGLQLLTQWAENPILGGSAAKERAFIWSVLLI